VTGSGSVYTNTNTFTLGGSSVSGSLYIEDGGIVVATASGTSDTDTVSGFTINAGGKLYLGGGYLAISGDSMESTLEGYIEDGYVYALDASGSNYVQVTALTESSLLSLNYYSSGADNLSLYTALGLDMSLSYTILTNTYNSVPEPATYALFGGVGALGLALLRGKRN
jgi:hypothetical protein